MNMLKKQNKNPQENKANMGFFDTEIGFSAEHLMPPPSLETVKVQDSGISLVLQICVGIGWQMLKAELEALGFTSGLTTAILSNDVIGVFG